MNGASQNAQQAEPTAHHHSIPVIIAMRYGIHTSHDNTKNTEKNITMFVLVIGILVNIEDVSMVYGSITAGSAFVTPGEVKPRSVFEDITSLRPTISLAILCENILLDGIFYRFACIIIECSSLL